MSIFDQYVQLSEAARSYGHFEIFKIQSNPKSTLTQTWNCFMQFLFLLELTFIFSEIKIRKFRIPYGITLKNTTPL